VRDLETSKWDGLTPHWAVRSQKKKKKQKNIFISHRLRKRTEEGT